MGSIPIVQNIELLNEDVEPAPATSLKVDDTEVDQHSDSEIDLSVHAVPHTDERTQTEFLAQMKDDSENIRKQLSSRPACPSDEDIIQACFSTNPPDTEGFLPVVSRRRRRRRQSELPPRPPSTIQTRSVNRMLSSQSNSQ